MAGYKPIKIVGLETGLVQEREDFLLPSDAYPVLENAYVWRERIMRKSGCKTLGRLRRTFDTTTFFSTSASPWSFNLLKENGYISAINIGGAPTLLITTKYAHGLTTGDTVVFSGVVGTTELNGNTYSVTVTGTSTFQVTQAGPSPYTSGGFFFSNRTILTREPRATLEPGSVTLIIGGAVTLTDTGFGTLTSGTAGYSGTINYNTGNVVITHTSGAGVATTIKYNYYPGLPVMGLRQRELTTINTEYLVAFDTRYAYRFGSTGFTEFIIGTRWTGNDSDFFYSTNYYVDGSNNKLFWVTNFSGTSGDPIRYTNGTTWTDFAPTLDSGANLLTQCLILIPFRGRLLALNTYEGTSLAASINHPNRIRWSAIGSPITATSWRDDIRGEGGWLDIPSAEHIVAAGFVRDNLVIYCENSTWQLRHTGQSIAPFSIEKVNTELGSESTFSAISFDKTLVGIGDKGIVECDSFQSNRIDIKIPDFAFGINNENDGVKRVHGIRDQEQRLAYWIYPISNTGHKFPDRRLVYNYENQSWAIFKDSFTCLGIYWGNVSYRWQDLSGVAWRTAHFRWVDRQSGLPYLIAGNQLGFVMYLDSLTINDPTLFILGITGNGATYSPTQITVYDHNLVDGDVIKISSIPTGTGYASLNGGVYGVTVIDSNNLYLWEYNSTTGDFDKPRLDALTNYAGGGLVSVKDNFRVLSKKFEHMDAGQKIQIGYLDVLTKSTSAGAITIKMYVDYRTDNEVNNVSDTCFNKTVPTSQTTYSVDSQDKYWHRVFCPVRANFVQFEWTLSNAQMNGGEQESDVQIDAQIIYERTAGRMTI